MLAAWLWVSYSISLCLRVPIATMRGSIYSMKLFGELSGAQMMMMMKKKNTQQIILLGPMN